jgi:hypothetical protein
MCTVCFKVSLNTLFSVFNTSHNTDPIQYLVQQKCNYMVVTAVYIIKHFCLR